MSDLFAHPDGRCGECGGSGGGHFIDCSQMETEEERRVAAQIARNGVCPKCHFIRPCECS